MTHIYTYFTIRSISSLLFEMGHILTSPIKTYFNRKIIVLEDNATVSIIIKEGNLFR